ncbi:MAG: M48 family metallopeptidase [Limisphaerales bacterium]
MPHRWLQQLELWLSEHPTHRASPIHLHLKTPSPVPPRPPGAQPPPAGILPPDRSPPPTEPVPKSSTAEPTTPTPGLPPAIPLVFKKNARARRYILRVARDGTVHVTIPRGGTEALAQRFAIEKEAWIRDQLERVAQVRAGQARWGPGTPVWFRGDRHPVVALADHARIGEFIFPLPPPDKDWRPAVERHLRSLAATELPPLVLGAADLHAVKVDRVQVRDQRTRWGSCSRRGTISLNWRLVQVPYFVRDYLIAHELAHLRQMNHSRRFWAVVEEFYPSWRDAERWLREYGRRLLA